MPLNPLVHRPVAFGYDVSKVFSVHYDQVTLVKRPELATPEQLFLPLFSRRHSSHTRLPTGIQGCSFLSVPFGDFIVLL